MIVLYPVLVLSVIAGNGLVFADDAAPASTSANATSAASADEAALSTISPPDQTNAPAVPTVTTTKDTPAPSKAEESKTGTNDDEEAPMADNYDSYKVDKVKLASTLDRITKMVDANPTLSKGSAAIPLLPGKNYDFFLLKVPKTEGQPEKAQEKQQRDVSRSLESLSYENNRRYPNSAALANERPPCSCFTPPPQVAPDLSALQNLYGNALNFNGMLDPGCPPGQVQTVVPNGMAMLMMPAIDSIPLLDFNSLGPSSYQYSLSTQNNYQLPAQNHLSFQNPYNPSIPGQHLENPLGLLQYPQNGGTPPPYIQNGAFPPPYPHNGAFLPSYPQNGALPSPYSQNEALSSPQNGVLPLSNPQNGGFPLPYQPPGAIPSLYPHDNYNLQLQSQQYKQNRFVPYDSSLFNAPFGNIQPQQTSGFLRFPESLIPENKGYDIKSAKSLW